MQTQPSLDVSESICSHRRRAECHRKTFRNTWADKQPFQYHRGLHQLSVFLFLPASVKCKIHIMQTNIHQSGPRWGSRDPVGLLPDRWKSFTIKHCHWKLVGGLRTLGDNLNLGGLLWALSGLGGGGLGFAVCLFLFLLCQLLDWITL